MPLVQELKNLLSTRSSQATMSRLGVALVYVYGSRVKDRSHQESDYDFAVLLDDQVKLSFLQRVERLDKLAEWLAEVLACQRDLIDVQDLDEMPVSISFHALGDGALLWESEPDLGVCYRRQVYSRYQDFEYAESIFRKGLCRRMKGDTKVG